MNPYIKEADALFGRRKPVASEDAGREADLPPENAAMSGVRHGRSVEPSGGSRSGMQTPKSQASGVDGRSLDRHPCPECNANLEWSARKQALACPYCGTVVPWQPGVRSPRHDSGAVGSNRRGNDGDGDAAGAAHAGAGETTSAAATDEGHASRVTGSALNPAGENAPADAGSLHDSFQRTANHEHDLEAALRDPANLRDWGTERREVKCQSCHAVSVFVDGKVAQRCDFCGSPAIVPHEEMQDAITPQSILPFRVSDAQVRDILRTWYGSRWFAPNRLKRAALTDTLKGIYLPYWTFDARAHAVWRAEAGHYYYETQLVRGPDGRSQHQQVQKVRWVPASGQLQHFFDDELVPGTVGVHAPLLRRIEPFPTTTDLKAYAPEYVRGWTVERYQVDLRRASGMGEQQMAQQLRLMCAQRVPGDTHRNLVVDARLEGRTFKHVLMPVWLVSYTYGSRSYQVVVNGYTGKVAGEQPYSWIKIMLAVLLALLVLGAIAYSQR